jgi:hypothetical protein
MVDGRPPEAVARSSVAEERHPLFGMCSGGVHSRFSASTITREVVYYMTDCVW